MRKSILLTSCLLTVLATMSLAVVTQAADNSPVVQSSATITVRAGIHPDFERIVFDWPRTTKYSLKKNGTQGQITFAASALLKFDTQSFSHLQRAQNFTSATDQDGNLTVTFNVPATATLESFTSGNSIAIDIRGSKSREDGTNASPAKSVALISLPPQPKQKDVLPPEAIKSSEKPIPEALPPTSPGVAKGANGETSTTSAVMKTATSLPVKDHVSTLPETPISPLTSIPQASPPPSNAIPVPVNTLVKNPTNTVTAVDIGDTPLLVLTLDPHTPTRAVVFQRAGFAYVVFDRKLTIPLATLTENTVSHVQPEALDLPNAAGFRFPIPPNIDIHSAHNDTAWQIYFSHVTQDVPVSTTLVAQPDFALGARLLLPLPDAPDPVHMTDPVVGDDLILVPLTQNEAFSAPRTMADFQVISAAQGLVIKPFTDKIIVRPVTDGIEITAEGGLHLSSSMDTGASQQSSQKAKAAEAGKSIFDFASWRGKPEETFTQTRQRLEQTIVDVPESERNRARLELARFYFAQGNGEEALGMLNYLAKQLPDLLAHADFMALLGASEISAHRPEDGLKDLDGTALHAQPEIELWQAVGNAELRNWQVAEEKFSVTESMLYGYPEPFHSRFGILAIESALAMDKDHEAADWLSKLETNVHDDSIDPAIQYLHAVLHAKAGRAQSAEAAWKDVMASNDRLYKVRAEMALIDLGVSTRSLTPAQAVARLEALRFAWRGDDLEVDILHRLGQFYVQAKNIKAGLNVMSQAIQLYPSSPMAPSIKAEMAQIFHDVFLTDLGASLSPLDALTLYQQYHNLMPTGKDGDAVLRNLAERLVAVDLLEQSASLLEDLAKNRLQGEEKARVVTRLAAIRLLDHNPDQALVALDYDKGETLPADVQSDQMLMRAKSLSELHKDDDALALLHDNSTTAAKLLRADITMHAKHWDDAAKALLDLVGSPPGPGVVLSHDQAEWLVNCAIAMSLSGNMTGLDKLAIDYGAAMAGTPESDTFRVLTAPEKTTQLRDITAAQSRIADVDMFQSFLNSYRKTEEPTTPTDGDKSKN